MNRRRTPTRSRPPPPPDFARPPAPRYHPADYSRLAYRRQSDQLKDTAGRSSRSFAAYLRAYFDRLAAHLPRDEFKLNLVDGFAGGRTYLDAEEILSAEV